MAQAPQEGSEQKQSFSDRLKGYGKKAQDAAKVLQAKAEDRLSMEGLLLQARESLQAFLNPELDVEKQIPREVLKNAKGVVFLSIIKAGLGLGAEGGTGVTIVRTEDGSWSAPVAIGAGGLKWGLQIGASKVDYIMVLYEKESVDTFCGKGQLKLGGDANISVGPKGRDAQVGLAASDKGIAPIIAYSMAKGAYIGITLNAEMLMVRADCNEKFYGRKVNVLEVLRGEVKMPENPDHAAIGAILDTYITTGRAAPQQ